MRTLLRITLWTAIIAALLVGGLRAVAIRWWRVPINDPWLEASIEPSLRGGDLIVLWRLTPPHFGDLVICPEPKAPERIVIGRLLGEARDNIEIDGSSVTVNGHHYITERPCDERTISVKHPGTAEPVEQSCNLEAVGGGVHQRAEASGHRSQPARVVANVPEGRVFLVSDNRLFPFDSRDYGPVERSTCAETVLFRLVGRDGFFDVGRRFTYIH
jgi:signal peptidase I